MRKTINVLTDFSYQNKFIGKYYSIPKLKKIFNSIDKLPYSLRIILESMLRNIDDKVVTIDHINSVINPHAPAGKFTPRAIKIVSSRLMRTIMHGAI